MSPRPATAIDRLGLATWAALALLQLAWHGWLFPPRTVPVWLALALAVVPLLLPLLALRNLRRALLWTGILSLFYFCHGVAEAWSAPGERALAWLEIVLTVLLIGTLGAGVRYKPKT
jgi:uncharacterized membrane protein